jgi:tail length tape measure protein
MADLGRDIELRIRAVDSTQADLRGLVQSINAVTAALKGELEAAAAGKRGSDELRASITQLEQAHKGLTGIGALVDQYNNLNKRIEESQTKVAQATAAQNAYQAELAQTEERTRAQEQALRRLNAERERATRTLAQQQNMLATTSADLQRAGVDIENLAGAEHELVAASEQLKTSLPALRQAYADNARVIREQREQAAALREEERQRVEAARQAAAAEREAAVAAATAAKEKLAADTAAAAAEQRVADAEKKRQDEFVAIQMRLEQMRRQQTAAAQAEAQRQTAIAAAEAEKQAKAAEAAEKERTRIAQQEADKRAAKEREYDQIQLRLETFRRQQLQAAARAEEQQREQARQREQAALKNFYDLQARMRGGGAAAGGAAGPETFLGLRPYELQNLSYQINDVISGLTAGQHLTQVMAQQGGQIFQLWGSNLFAIGRYLPQIAIGLAAITAAYSLFSSTVREATTEREFAVLLQQSGEGAGKTAVQMRQLTESVKALGIAYADAQKIVTAGLNAGASTGQTIALANIARDIAVPRSLDIVQVFNDLVKGLKGGADGIADFNKQLNLFTTAELAAIRETERLSGVQAAQQQAIDILGQKTKDGADNVGLFTKALKDLGNAWDDLMKTLREAGVVKEIQNNLNAFFNDVTKVLNAITDTIRTVKGLPAAVGAITTGSGTVGGGTSGNVVSVTGTPGATVSATVTRQGASAGPGPTFTNTSPVDTRELKIAIDALTEATKTAGLPPGYRVEVLNTERPGSRVAGTGAPSEHGAGRAVDVRIVDENGRPIPGSMGTRGGGEAGYDTTGLYTKLDTAFEAYLKANYPNEQYAVGTRFQRTPDPGHYSVGAGHEETVQGQREGRGGAAGTGGGGLGPTQAEVDRSKKLLDDDLRRQQIQFDLNRQVTEAAEKENARQEAIKQGLVGKDQEVFVERRLAEFRARRDAEERKFNQDKENQAISDGKHAAEIDAAGRAARAKAIEDSHGLITLEQAQTAEMQGREEARKKFANEEAGRVAQRQIDQNLINRALAAELKGYTDIEKVLDNIREKQKLQREADAKTIEDFKGKGINITVDENLRKQVEARELANAEADARLKNLQTVVQTRADTVSAINAAVSAGAMTITEGQDAIKKAYESTTPEIEKQTTAFLEWLKTQKDLDPNKIEQLTAKIKQMRVESQYVDPLWKGIKDTFTSSFATNISTFFDTISQSIGNLIAKTGSWKDVMNSVKSAAGSLFAQLLKDIANYIIKAEAAKLASSIFGVSTDAADSGSGIGGFFSKLFGIGGSAAAGAGGSAAASVPLMTGGLYHQGGVVGLTAVPQRAWQADWTRSAPRYHQGTIVGLAPGEQAAILQRGEEVLSRNNPRNILNGGGVSAGINIRSVLVDDPRRVPEAMAGAHGERVIVQTLVKNAATVRQLVKG